MKYKLMCLFIVLLSISTFFIGCDNNSTTIADEYFCLRNTYSQELSESQIEVVEGQDYSWSYYPYETIIPYEGSKNTEEQLISPLLTKSLDLEDNLNKLFRIEISTAYWEVTHGSIKNMPQEYQSSIYNSYNAFLAYHDAGLLPSLTQIVFVTENDINRPLKIIGLWTKDEILNFESNCNEVFHGLENYISIHLTTK